MKSNALPILSILAALAAFVILPANMLAVSIAFTVAGTLSILLSDYHRELTPLRVNARAIPFDAPGRPSAELREAA